MQLLTINALTFDDADRIADELAFIEPEPVSISIVEEADERSWRVEAQFSEPPPIAELDLLAGMDWRLAPLIERDWVRESLIGLAPVRAGRFFIHGAHDRGAAPPGAIDIEIEASLAFGTGHHGTTRGCLLALDDLLKREIPWPVLDLGCGSGVLALAYARATHRRVLATDIDPVAIEQTRANARKNKAGPWVIAHTASGVAHQIIRSQAPYRLIMANILARPLEALAPALARLLKPGGHIILSGLTIDQEARVLAAYRAQALHLSRRIRLEGWSTLMLTARP
ncbi:50S ribosomal protein L11 methyltransferase [Rhodoligotrophos ferricapiens]|uniref:50S ribosomal protein L11 methyltransferase n=1 Tax=Rhodoligotrophos ferricapiens TaxID=3069264 RepID=UPI00315DA470